LPTVWLEAVKDLLRTDSDLDFFEVSAALEVYSSVNSRNKTNNKLLFFINIF